MRQKPSVVYFLNLKLWEKSRRRGRSCSHFLTLRSWRVYSLLWSSVASRVHGTASNYCFIVSNKFMGAQRWWTHRVSHWHWFPCDWPSGGRHPVWGCRGVHPAVLSPTTSWLFPFNLHGPLLFLKDFLGFTHGRKTPEKIWCDHEKQKSANFVTKLCKNA